MDSVAECCKRWLLTLGKPFEQHGAKSSWVAPVVLANGSTAVLKFGMAHMEGEHGIQGLRFRDANKTVRRLNADEENNAMLLERRDTSGCSPMARHAGNVLRAQREPWSIEEPTYDTTQHLINCKARMRKLRTA